MPRLIGRFIAVTTSLFLATSLCVPLVIAQNSAAGTLTGLIVDEAGSPIAGAIATIINLGTGNTDSRRTDVAGRYRFDYKPAGRYRVDAEKDGYLNSTIENFSVQLNKVNSINLPQITLHRIPAATPNRPVAPNIVDAVPESLINTADASRGGNFSERELNALPIGGASTMRSFDEYAFLLTGVAPPPFTPGLRGPGIGYGIGTAGEFSVNGQRARSNNFTVDGSDNNDPDVGVRRQGFVALVPQSIESIQDFHVSTQLWDSEQGRNVGSLVNAVSKDGSNAIHGQVYGFFTHDALNARNFFDKTGFAGDHEFRRGQFGAVVGAPIKQDRTHLFGSFEHLSITERGEQHFATPGAEERRFLGLNRLGVLSPTSTFLPNEFIARHGGRTAIGTNILSLIPEPNNPGGPFGINTFTQILPADGDGNIASVKLNHEFAAGRVLNGRYNFTDDSRTLPSINRAINSTTEARTRTQDMSLIYESQYGDRLSNQARFSYGRTRLDLLLPVGTPATLSAGSTERVSFPGGGSELFFSGTGEIGELDIEPFSPVGVNANAFPQKRASNTFQYADSMTWTLGDHSLKFGADIRRVQLNSRLDRNYRSQVVYGGALLTTGVLNGFTNFVPSYTPEQTRVISGVQLATLGFASSIFQTITKDSPDSTIGLRFTESNFFFNDSWRVGRTFKLDYGMRYEYNTVPKETNKRIEDALVLNNLPSLGNSLINTPERTQAFDDAVAAYKQVLDGRKTIYDPDRNNIGGHLSFAWNPEGRSDLSLRGGYGIYYDAILGAVVNQSRNVFPNEISFNSTSGLTRFDFFITENPELFRFRDPDNFRIDIPLIRFGSVNQFGGNPEDFVPVIGELFRQASRGGGFAFTLPDKHLRTPYVQQWNMTIEKELFRDYFVSAAYVGNKGTKLTRLTTPNLGPNVIPTIHVADADRGVLSNLLDFPLVFTDCLEFENKPCRIQPNRPLSALGPYQIFENSANSTYHALQIETHKRYAHGYTFSIAYTWSHAIDEVSDVFPIAGAPIIAQNSLNLKAERGNANFDVRHLFSASLVWDIPFLHDAGGMTGRIFGNWQLASILQAHTGEPFTLNVPFDANFDGNLTDRPSTTDGLIFKDRHGAQKVSVADGRQFTDFFVLGRDGAVGRNTVRGDGYLNLDVALNKNIAIAENHHLLFRFEVFNVFNRANFGLPIRTIGAPGFGSAVETINPARLIQFALKYQF